MAGSATQSGAGSVTCFVHDSRPYQLYTTITNDYEGDVAIGAHHNRHRSESPESIPQCMER